jgi:hypothetical protein
MAQERPWALVWARARRLAMAGRLTRRWAGSASPLRGLAGVGSSVRRRRRERAQGDAGASAGGDGMQGDAGRREFRGRIVWLLVR